MPRTGHFKTSTQAQAKKQDRAQLLKTNVWAYGSIIWLKGYQNIKSVCLLSLCCVDCPHAFCRHGEPEMPPEPRRFKDGPPVSQFPFPVRDPDRPWGGPRKEGNGHYLKPQQSLERTSGGGISV